MIPKLKISGETIGRVMDLQQLLFQLLIFGLHVCEFCNKIIGEMVGRVMDLQQLLFQLFGLHAFVTALDFHYTLHMTPT